MTDKRQDSTQQKSQDAPAQGLRAPRSSTPSVAPASSERDSLIEENFAKVERLGKARISRLVLEFSIPSIIGLVVNGLYNIISAVFLGWADGQAGLAVATIAMPTMIFSMAVSILIGAGGNAVLALRLGEGKHEIAERILGNAFILTIVASVLCTAFVCIFTDQVLVISGATPEIWEVSRDFIRILAIGFFLQFFGLGFNNFIRTAGDPNRALYTMVAGTVVCIILSYFFVMVFQWGVAGMGWATVIGQAVSAVLVFWYFAFSKKAPFKLRISEFRLQMPLVRSILALGSAPFALQLANAIVNFFINNQLVAYGALHVIGSQGALASIGVVVRIALFAFFPVLGVATAVQPIFGFNYGARNFDRVKATFKAAFAWVVAIGIFFWVIVHAMPEPLVDIFGVKSDLREFTIFALKVQVFMLPVMGLQVVSANYFQSSGQPIKAMFLTLTRQILYLIPLLYLLPLVIRASGVFGLNPLDGVYFAYPVADFLSIITAAIMMIVEWRRLTRLMREGGMREGGMREGGDTGRKGDAGPKADASRKGGPRNSAGQGDSPLPRKQHTEKGEGS
ncbi:MAG: MATE family efflux transporter [Coriobacteriales bacterium]|nr:MATE family efflux transporter [Coriobacteriales bacterium]